MGIIFAIDCKRAFAFAFLCAMHVLAFALPTVCVLTFALHVANISLLNGYEVVC